MIESLDLENQTVVEGRFEVGKKIHNKNGISIYGVRDMTNEKESLLMKTQKVDIFTDDVYNELEFLETCIGYDGFPTLIDNFIMHNEYSCIVMTNEGKTLMSHLKHRNFKLTMQNTIRLGHRLFALLEKMHFLGYVHRDVHFQNVMVDTDWDEDVVIKLIDFERTVKAHPPQKCFGWIAWHESINIIRDGEYTQIDDFISALFLMMMSQNVNPFGLDISEYIRLKEIFHKNPLSHFKDPATEWLGRLYMELESMRPTGYNKFKVRDILQGAIPNFDPKSPFTSHCFNGEVYLD